MLIVAKDDSTCCLKIILEKFNSGALYNNFFKMLPSSCMAFFHVFTVN